MPKYRFSKPSKNCPRLTPIILRSGQLLFTAKCADSTESIVVEANGMASGVCDLLFSATFRTKLSSLRLPEMELWFALTVIIARSLRMK